jgi:hypothetical protein
MSPNGGGIGPLRRDGATTEPQTNELRPFPCKTERASFFVGAAERQGEATGLCPGASLYIRCVRHGLPGASATIAVDSLADSIVLREPEAPRMCIEMWPAEKNITLW